MTRPRPSGPRRPRREVLLPRPRLSVLHVLDRVRIRMIDIQVWDVAGTMTFYMLLSVFPAAVAAASLVSMLGIQEQTIDAFSDLVVEIFPAVDPRPYAAAILAAANARGGLLGLLLGTIGALLSASNGVAAFHRAMHHVYDTREGRPFLWFRLIVFGETVVIVAVLLLSLGIVILGGEASQVIGELIGIPRTAFLAWNAVKWPILLVILIIGVSLAYYLFPNVRLPRYRVMTLGSAFSVLVLFCGALVAGRLAGYATRFSELITTLNGLIGLLLLLWLANIVIVVGAALDAEFLRARQIALGLPAWEHIELTPHATHALDFLAADAERSEEIGREVADAARTGRPVRRPRSLRVVDARNPLAVNPRLRLQEGEPEEPSVAAPPDRGDPP
ncbi:YihY/virulence factor BrkB family protein [Brachybacterium hainanense]|uniref:YihY/virulence factor BrkB family protein n=1 Tax=Brachybacterium hainanense TaxID=1541174 RepID=A0ABV6RJB9_9MICO